MILLFISEFYFSNARDVNLSITDIIKPEVIQASFLLGRDVGKFKYYLSNFIEKWGNLM